MKGLAPLFLGIFGTFTQQTAAFIVIANKSVPTTSPTISRGSGAIAAARRAITFLSGRYFSEKCGWARTSPTLARAHQRLKNLRRLQLKERRCPARRRHKQFHLHPRVRLEQQPPHHPAARPHLRPP